MFINYLINFLFISITSSHNTPSSPSPSPSFFELPNELTPELTSESFSPEVFKLLYNTSPPSFNWTPEIVEEYRRFTSKYELLTFQSLILNELKNKFINLYNKLKIKTYVIGQENSHKINIWKKLMNNLGINNYNIIDINRLPWKISRETFINDGVITPRYYVGRYKFLLSLTLSHEGILRDFLKTDGHHLWIMEDDATIAHGLTLNDVFYGLSDLFSMQIPKPQWDISYPGFCYASRSILKMQRGKQTLENDKNIPPKLNHGCIPPLCAHSIIYTRATVKLILDKIRPFYYAYDAIVQDIVCKGGIFYYFYFYNSILYYFFFPFKIFICRFN